MIPVWLFAILILACAADAAGFIFLVYLAVQEKRDLDALKKRP